MMHCRYNLLLLSTLLQALLPIPPLGHLGKGIALYRKGIAVIRKGITPFLKPDAVVEMHIAIHRKGIAGHCIDSGGNRNDDSR